MSIKKQLKETTSTMYKEDQAKFYGELADWAYSQHETLSIDDECEMQNYDEY